MLPYQASPKSADRLDEPRGGAAGGRLSFHPQDGCSAQVRQHADASTSTSVVAPPCAERIAQRPCCDVFSVLGSLPCVGRWAWYWFQTYGWRNLQGFVSLKTRRNFVISIVPAACCLLRLGCHPQAQIPDPSPHLPRLYVSSVSTAA